MARIDMILSVALLCMTLLSFVSADLPSQCTLSGIYLSGTFYIVSAAEPTMAVTLTSNKTLILTARKSPSGETTAMDQLFYFKINQGVANPCNGDVMTVLGDDLTTSTNITFSKMEGTTRQKFAWNKDQMFVNLIPKTQAPKPRVLSVKGGIIMDGADIIIEDAENSTRIDQLWKLHWFGDLTEVSPRVMELTLADLGSSMEDAMAATVSRFEKSLGKIHVGDDRLTVEGLNKAAKETDDDDDDDAQAAPATAGAAGTGAAAGAAGTGAPAGAAGTGAPVGAATAAPADTAGAAAADGTAT